MQLNMKAKVAIVTGGGTGIGRATAVAFAQEGAKIVIADINVEAGQEAVRLVQAARGEAIFVKTDVSKEADVAAMVQKAVEVYGRLDYASNNAGIPQPPKKLVDLDEAFFERIIGINLKGVWLAMKYEIPQMLKNGGGAIVNTSSIIGMVGSPSNALYAASKHGVWGLTKAAALEYIREGIRINAVGPGGTDTQMVQDVLTMLGNDPSIIDELKAGHPIGRMGKPEEVADAVLYLCSDRASYITGQMLMADGGYTAQ